MGGIQQENNDDNLTKHSFGLNACELQDGLRNMGPVWFCSALVNSDTLTVYYGVKQSQFTKPTPEPPRQ